MTPCAAGRSKALSCTSDVAGLDPDREAARDLGIRSYVNAPVTGPDGDVFGTICGASNRSIELNEEARLVLETVAAMISLQMAHDAATQTVVEQAVPYISASGESG